MRVISPSPLIFQNCISGTEFALLLSSVILTLPSLPFVCTGVYMFLHDIWFTVIVLEYFLSFMIEK